MNVKKFVRTVSAMLAVLVLLLILPVSSVAAGSGEGTDDGIYKLWYTEPAAMTQTGFLTQSLPLGNGYMGVNVFGGTDTDLISVTENSMVNPYVGNEGGG